MGAYKVIEYTHVISFSRDSLFLTPTFDFHFKVAIPKKRKEREILQRDALGRILVAKVPEHPYYYEEK